MNAPAPPTAIDIYADGACKGNPGPGGWGALMVIGGEEHELFGGEPSTTNNRMELTAVIRALESLDTLAAFGAAGPAGGAVRLHTDSQYVQLGITEWIHGWKRRGWRTADRKPVKNADLWIRLDQLAAGRTLEWYWVRGHAGHPGNERADGLANRGVATLLSSPERKRG